MKIIGYAPSYAKGRQLARDMGYDFAHCVPSNQAPLTYTVMV